MQRLCIFCEHFYFDSGYPAYSELTPGMDMRMGCNKDVWDEENCDDIRVGNNNAINCEMYKASEDALKMGAPE